jgi:hypothetical protein
MSGTKTIIITGSSGFIGSAVIRKFSGRFNLVGLDRIASHAPPTPGGVRLYRSNLGVEAAFDRVRIAYGDRIASVIHLAAYYDLSGTPNPLYEEITVRGTERRLQSLQEFTVEQFIFTSTMLVHAPAAPGRPISAGCAAGSIGNESAIRGQRNPRPLGFAVDDENLSQRLDRIERLLHAVSWLVIDLIGFAVGFAAYLPVTHYEQMGTAWALIAAVTAGLVAMIGCHWLIARAPRLTPLSEKVSRLRFLMVRFSTRSNRRMTEESLRPSKSLHYRSIHGRSQRAEIEG